MFVNVIQECKAAGEDFDRVKVLDVQADQAERWEKTKEKKKNPDVGFSSRCFLRYASFHLLYSNNFSWWHKAKCLDCTYMSLRMYFQVTSKPQFVSISG